MADWANETVVSRVVFGILGLVALGSALAWPTAPVPLCRVPTGRVASHRGRHHRHRIIFGSERCMDGGFGH